MSAAAAARNLARAALRRVTRPLRHAWKHRPRLQRLHAWLDRVSVEPEDEDPLAPRLVCRCLVCKRGTPH